MILLQVFVTNNMLNANKIGSIKDSNKSIEKCEKLLKTILLSKFWKLSKLKNLKGGKLFKSQKAAKSEKKLSKSRNLPNFDDKKNELSFWTLKTRVAFNRLWLAFIEVSIL